jgi:hypothetical protein
MEPVQSSTIAEVAMLDTVKINGAPVSDVGADGIFAAACFLSRPEITVEAVADGKTRTVTRTFRLVD